MPASIRASASLCGARVSALRHTWGVIAAVAVDVALPHLDRTFDYRVPAEMEPLVAIGQRVRVRFAGRILTGFVLGLHDDTAHATADLRAIVSSAEVLPPPMAALVRAVADRYASTFADVVRFAVPPRHGRAEAAALLAPHLPVLTAAPLTGELSEVRGVSAFFERTERGESLAACLELPTLLDLPNAVARLVQAALAAGSVIVVAPDATDVARIRAALLTLDIPPIVMQAGDGPAARQRAFTAASMAARSVLVGTRSAAFAPMTGRGTTIVVGDGNDALVEPHTPGWHAREVALLRNRTHGWSSLFVARHRSLEMQILVEQGHIKSLVWPVDRWRQLSTRIEAVPERLEDADPLMRQLRIPPSVFRAIRETLTQGPVVLSVPQRGYITSVRCSACREAGALCSVFGPNLYCGCWRAGSLHVVRDCWLAVSVVQRHAGTPPRAWD